MGRKGPDRKTRKVLTDWRLPEKIGTHRPHGACPGRANPPPNGTGSAFTEFDSFSVSVGLDYAVFKGHGEFFNGLYAVRFSDGAQFTVTESFTLNPGNFGEIFGVFFRETTS